ncbi:hypothetical protein [Chitinophaga arvensicola]|uniref:hypothetical protein n=1 Tax=Chitinophaga arvensicola TaxID=29529 RepID=UPI00115FD34B|nr:hypothetical protein [Chitinophaga arvensicola]
MQRAKAKVDDAGYGAAMDGRIDDQLARGTKEFELLYLSLNPEGLAKATNKFRVDESTSTLYFNGFDAKVYPGDMTKLEAEGVKLKDVVALANSAPLRKDFKNTAEFAAATTAHIDKIRQGLKPFHKAHQEAYSAMISAMDIPIKTSGFPAPKLDVATSVEESAQLRFFRPTDKITIQEATTMLANPSVDSPRWVHKTYYNKNKNQSYNAYVAVDFSGNKTKSDNLPLRRVQGTMYFDPEKKIGDFNLPEMNNPSRRSEIMRDLLAGKEVKLQTPSPMYPEILMSLNANMATYHVKNLHGKALGHKEFRTKEANDRLASRISYVDEKGKVTPPKNQPKSGQRQPRAAASDEEGARKNKNHRQAAGNSTRVVKKSGQKAGQKVRP